MINKVVPYTCLGLILFVAPIIRQPKVAMTKDVKGVVNSEFVLIVDDIVDSKSGLRMCKMTIKDVDKQVIGPCSTTDGAMLVVGNTYKVGRAKIDKGFISINKAENIGSPDRWEVVDVFVRASTSLMKVRNGDVEKIVGNNNGHVVGSYVTGY